jgi:cytidylate kinase
MREGNRPPPRSAMNPLPLVEKAQAYLNIHLTHSGAAAAPEPTGPFVTISRESGTGGAAFAAALAERLTAISHAEWTVHSGNLIEEMLRANDLPPRLARFLPEDRVSEVDASVGEILGLHPNLWTLIDKTKILMRQLARSSHVILLGRGANFATADLPHGVHLRLIAPPAVRAARMARLRGISFDDAAGLNVDIDAARQRYVRANFGGDIATPIHYDIVLNLADVPLTCCLDLVERLVAAHAPAVTRPA